MAQSCILEPDLNFIKEIKKSGGATLKKCYQCATCSVVCNLSPADRPFPRKEMIYAQWGQIDKLVGDPDLWLCYQCNDCTTRCPRGARPGDVLAAIRTYIYRHYSFPRFMGKALASPAALPLLLLVPALVIVALMLAYTGADFSFMNREIRFGEFIPHGWIEGLFISGNVLIFAFAFIGLLRFWNMLGKNSPVPRRNGFISSLVATVKSIISHSNFAKCEANRPRYYAHILVFFGFLGAMATAGLALLAMILINLDPPIPLSHPIKWLGNASGFAGVAGLTIMISRRLTGKDKVGANGYADWLFLIMLLLVFLTGLLSQFLRLAESPLSAYSIYFIHLLVVFFLLWYAPYSKFGHMFYRSIALVHARSIGREAGKQ